MQTTTERELPLKSIRKAMGAVEDEADRIASAMELPTEERTKRVGKSVMTLRTLAAVVTSCAEDLE